ncbi:MAG: coenzyme F420-0:L-glutamate ligase [Erysipelotrichaceae bacterium]|jgi:F420-0:gamma-glutamyl ligase|nr:coenzyme F420-0:L-glutamate ligase [Bacillota bacterium]NLP22320.1 F420-0--gamma-glutamyl ligase [Erysipelotrichaceae bacterium]
MSRTLGTVVRGIRTPIVKEGDDVVQIVFDSLKEALESENITLRDKDVIGITESLIARAQGNYCTTKDIAEDVNSKFKGRIGVVFPILSRNRFSIILKGIIESGKKVTLLLSYPSDEVGNHLMDLDDLDNLKINPHDRVLTEKEYRDLFGEKVYHEFTRIDYVKLYKDIGKDNIEIIFANDPRVILNYTDEVLVSDIHSRFRTKRLIEEAGGKNVLTLDDIMNKPINDSGYNPEYGILGSNLASDSELKLFPRDGQKYVDAIQEKFLQEYGKKIEVLIYGDGAFKDPVGKIWELADPCVSPAFTEGLKGIPNEIKIKYIADNELENVYGEEAVNIIKQKIYAKEQDLLGRAESLGTTPRQITDLIGSLCDLTSGSGDKGTPVVFIQGYFDNFASE